MMRDYGPFCVVVVRTHIGK